MTLHSDIDRIFREGLSDYSEKAPGFIWDNIENVLIKKRKIRQRNLLYSVAAAVALLLSFGSGYLFTNSKSVNGLIAEQKPKATNGTQPKTATFDNLVQPESNQVQLGGENQQLPPSTEKSKKQEVIEKKAIDAQTASPSIPKEKSIIKKALSSGTLLPPMFANEDNYLTENESPEYQSIDFIEPQESNLASIQPLGLESNPLASNRELVYPHRTIYSLTNELAQLPQEEEHKQISSWSVAMNASPLISYRDVYSVNNNLLDAADNASSMEQDYQNEKPLVSYVAGVDVNYRMTNRWNVQGGVYLSEIGQVSSNINLNNISSYNNTTGDSYSINTSAGNIIVNSSSKELIQMVDPKKVSNDYTVKLPGSINSSDNTQSINSDFVQTYRYYELPLMVNYRLIDRKLSMNISGGVSANVLYNQHVYMQADGKRFSLDAEVEDIKKMNYNGIVGLGFGYPIFSGLQFNVQPTLRYSLTAINNAGTVYPYSFGLFTGLIYNF